MTERIREIFETTLHDEPPLVDIVAGAMEGARLKRRKRRRDRIAVAVSPLALLALGVGAYAVLPGFGSATGGDKVASSPPSTPSAVFPTVAADKPVNATPAVHKIAVQLCTRDWSKDLAPLSTNMMPNTQQQAVDMCVMTGEALMTLMPGATVTLSDAPDMSMSTGPGKQWVVKTAAGQTQIGIDYVWPDGTYDKKHYGPFDVCRQNPVNPLAPDAGHHQYCVQTRPAQQFYGALTVDETDSTVSYSVANHDYGRYLINAVPVPIPVATKPTSGSYSVRNGQYIVPGHNEPAAMSLGQLANAFLDPRFNDYLVHYENYVLAHATADSFSVAGSKPPSSQSS